MDDPVAPFELGRMFFGEHPPLYYAEIVVRTVIIYGYTLALIRWIGGRSVAQLAFAAEAHELTIETLAIIAYHQPGTTTNILDPVSNIAASMNYVSDRYNVRADGANLAARVQQADPTRPPAGY